jgi:hypothetical protein
MARPVFLHIVRRGELWVLLRDGQPLHDFSHAQRATHEALGIARDLAETGEPAQVMIQAGDGRMIEVSADPEPPAPDTTEETSAVNPGC